MSGDRGRSQVSAPAPDILKKTNTETNKEVDEMLVTIQALENILLPEYSRPIIKNSLKRLKQDICKRTSCLSPFDEILVVDMYCNQLAN
jgi:hypothetical protein